MSLFSFLNPAKDFALEMAVKLWFDHTCQRYGHMTTIQIDSTAKSIHVELELKGEASPLKIDIARYELSTEAGETFIKLGESSPRETVPPAPCVKAESSKAIAPPCESATSHGFPNLLPTIFPARSSASCTYSRRFSNTPSDQLICHEGVIGFWLGKVGLFGSQIH